ncbi:MAG TPA: ribbon-helix-helix domain-containing protein [Gemmataceae bacterium]|nr:ribbon-helix-helix domain-containing protein [Gemmataceae bacterium]
MTTAHVPLTETEDRALAEIAAQTGKTRGDLLREAVSQYLNRFPPRDRLNLLRQGRGLWKDRDDLPSLETLRAEMDRF